MIITRGLGGNPITRGFASFWEVVVQKVKKEVMRLVSAIDKKLELIS